MTRSIGIGVVGCGGAAVDLVRANPHSDVVNHRPSVNIPATPAQEESPDA